jgi:hypothetical protein
VLNDPEMTVTDQSSNQDDARAPGTDARKLACARCGTAFTCNLNGPCWCGEETARLPLPKPGVPSPTGFDDCLCRGCLREVANAHAMPPT